jgi:hypothetical protein
MYRYKNYELESASIQLAETKKWTLSITISNIKANKSEISFQTFHAQNTFDTKEEADAHSYNFGKEIIDGKHPNAKLNF